MLLADCLLLSPGALGIDVRKCSLYLCHALCYDLHKVYTVYEHLTQKLVPFVIVPYSEFLSEFSEFLT